MPGQAAKVTVTERQHELLNLLRHAKSAWPTATRSRSPTPIRTHVTQTYRMRGYHTRRADAEQLRLPHPRRPPKLNET